MNTLNNIIPSPLLINLTLNSNYATSKYATSDFNGKENTNMINENLNSEMYVAGLGELGIIMENISYINNIIKEHNGDIISYNAKYASSTFYYEKDVFNKNYDIFNNVNNVWIYDTYNGKISYENISNNLKMLSLYKFNVKDFDSTEDDYDDVSVNYLKINNEHKDEFDISSYLFYSQDDLLDNLENTLTYNFFEDTLNEENKVNYSSFQFNEVFSIEHVDQKILKNDYNYFTTIDTLQYDSNISDLYYKISENNIDNYYKVDVINNLYDGSSGEVQIRKYTKGSDFYTLNEYKTNTSTNLNGYVVVDDSISYTNIYTTKFYKYSEGESITSLNPNNIIDSNIISYNEPIIVDSINSLQHKIKEILGKYKIIYNKGTDVNPNYVKLDNNTSFKYYAYYEGNDQQFYISPTLDNNFYINYNLSSNNEIKIKINFDGFIDSDKNYYNPLSMIVKFNVTYTSDKNSVILNLKKDNTEMFGNVILYGDIYENDKHIKDFIYTLIVTVPKDKELGENFEVTVSSGLKNDSSTSKYFDLNLDQINNIDKKTDDGTLKIKNFIKQTNTSDNYDFYESTFKISLINDNDNDLNSDFKSYSGNNLYLKLYFTGNNLYNSVENSISVKILNCKKPNTNNKIYFYKRDENIANTPEEITQIDSMKYSSDIFNKIYLYVGDQFEQNEHSNIYYSSNNTACLKVSNTATNNLQEKLQFNQQIIKGQKNGEVTITAEIKGNLYQRRKAELKINYIYFDQTLSLEFNDDYIENNEYRISGTHNKINEDVVKDKNNINRQCKYFEIDLPTPNVKLNDTNVTLQSNEINSLIDSLKFSLVGDKTNDSAIITIDNVEQNIESNVAFYKLNTNKKIQICVILDKNLHTDDNNVEIILYLKVICPENNNVKIRCPQTISYLKIVLYGDFKLNVNNNENELLMGMKTSSLRNSFVPNTHSLSYIDYIDSDDFDANRFNFNDNIYGLDGDDEINTGDYSVGESSSEGSSSEGSSTNNFIDGKYYKTINVNFDYSYYVCFVKDDLSIYLIDTNNSYIINHIPKNDQYEYTIMTNSGQKNIIVNSNYINIGHQQNNKYYKQISNKNIKIQYLDKTNIVEYPIYDSIGNDSIKIYSMPLLPSRKIDNYFDCEFYIVIPKLIRNDGKKYSIDQIYNNIKINIKFGDGEIKKTLSAYRRLNDCVIYKYQGVDLYDSNHIQNQEIIITILDLSEKNSIENQIVYSQKIFFNLFELKVEQGKYQNIDMQLRYSNYYPLKYPLKDTKKRYIELEYIPYDNISKYSIDTLKGIKTNSNINNNFNYNYDELSFNYSYMNSNITHKIEQMNLLEWFLKENGNGLMVDKSNKTDDNNPNYNMFSSYISCIDSKQYDIEKFGIYFRRYVNYDEFGIINALDKDPDEDQSSNVVNMLNISNFNNVNNEKKIDFKLYGLKNIIYLINSNIFNFNFDDVEYDQSVSDYVDEYEDDENNNKIIKRLSIFDDYLFIYNNTSDEIEFYFTDESHTLCQSTRRVSIKSKKLICYKPSRHDNYNIVIKNCKLENYEITHNKLYLNTDNQINLVSNIKHLLNIVNETEQFSFNIKYNENADVDKHFLTNATIKNNDNSDIIIIPIYNYTICKFGNLVVFNKL